MKFQLFFAVIAALMLSVYAAEDPYAVDAPVQMADPRTVRYTVTRRVPAYRTQRYRVRVPRTWTVYNRRYHHRVTHHGYRWVNRTRRVRYYRTVRRTVVRHY